jgi:hypothetical protein
LLKTLLDQHGSGRRFVATPTRLDAALSGAFTPSIRCDRFSPSRPLAIETPAGKRRPRG